MLARSTTLEFYETPDPFTRWLFTEMASLGHPLIGRLCEPCVGSGAILRAAALRPQEFGVENSWVTNDLDPRWPADLHVDATQPWPAALVCDYTVTNPPFSQALPILERALTASRRGVIMHLRASIHEVLKTGPRRTWMADHQPTGILWLPRFAYQRSPTTGEWTTDSVCACWVVWLHPTLGGPVDQFIRYAPTWVIDALKAYEPDHRRRMDALLRPEVVELEIEG